MAHFASLHSTSQRRVACPASFGKAPTRSAAAPFPGTVLPRSRRLDLDDDQAVLAALSALRSTRRAVAARALAEVLAFERAGQILVFRWSNEHQTFGQ